MADTDRKAGIPPKLREDMENLVDGSLKKAANLLQLTVDKDEPFRAFVTFTLALAILSKSMGMDRDTLLEGVGAAFDSIEEAVPNDLH